ncbi:hypothetical protein [Polyangium fumosum]|uniref:hypothetical protein n=1 Tax=Polyangium fumosum TaxID=889272 RepID=UPI0014797D46|nr:hypothetical protein [Polyangium fumosum]
MSTLRIFYSASNLVFALLLTACASGGSSDEGEAGGGSGGAGGGGSNEGGHGCFSTETTCNGKCVHLEDNASHCGACNHSCGPGGQCVNGTCAYDCNGTLVENPADCLNLYGAFETFPPECAGCGTPNSQTGTCGCPSPASALPLLVQSDCPGVPMRSATTLQLCVTPTLAPDSDFGGAYQVDDLDGWCGSTAQCRVGNPMAGGACACPAGFDEVIGLRSILRLPCNGAEGGSVVVLCGNKEAPLRTFGGAFQVDDVEPTCRVGNPWTGGCSCPAGTNEHVYRVMVDGGAGLYGSSIRLCMP